MLDNCLSGWWIRLIPDALLAAVATLLLDGSVGLFLGLFVGLYALELVRTILRGITSHLHWVTALRRRLERALLDDLRQKRYPEPDTNEDSAASYLRAVIDDDECPVPIRIEAAGQAYLIDFLRSEGSLVRVMQLEAGWKRALKEYKWTFTSRRQ